MGGEASRFPFVGGSGPIHSAFSFKILPVSPGSFSRLSTSTSKERESCETQTPISSRSTGFTAQPYTRNFLWKWTLDFSKMLSFITFLFLKMLLLLFWWWRDDLTKNSRIFLALYIRAYFPFKIQRYGLFQLQKEKPRCIAHFQPTFVDGGNVCAAADGKGAQKFDRLIYKNGNRI